MATMPVVTVPKAEAEQWRAASGQPLAMRAAMAWARYSPRAKGWMPRIIGRRFASGMKSTVRTRSGGIVAVDPANLDIYVRVVLNGGVWEKQIHDACCAVARPGDVVLDIGANAGIIAMDLAAHLKGDVRMFAFEPIPTLARTVALSAAINGLQDRITVSESMLGSAGGEASLFVPKHAIHASAKSREADAVELKRPVFTLDSLVESGQIPQPDFIKIDVEGAELEVFKGAAGLLRSRPPAIAFEADQNMQRFGYTRADLIGFLSGCSPYRYYYITAHGFTATDKPDESMDDDHNNLLALPPGRPEPRFGVNPVR
ncbi:MAG: FkbM family methyltransferase [Phycisphaerales bacterium]|nr:FkbM family methyltransferase [Phycisphaerales bacterium]